MLLIFPAEEIPVMARGQGVILQKYKDGAIDDIKFFNAADGLTYRCGSGTRTEENLTGWLGHRAQAGKMPPSGFLRSNKF